MGGEVIMSDIHKSLRLGDLLVEKGLITRQQLRQAIEIQQTLQSSRFGNKKTVAKTELGEILIELGFINRQQLQANLNWQRRLKATTAVMVFIAPLLTAACGGGGGAGAPVSTGNFKTEVSSLQSTAVSPKPEPINNSSASMQAVSSAPSLAISSSPAVLSSSSSSSSSSSTLSSTSSSLSSTSSTSSSPSSTSSSSSSSVVEGSVGLYWSAPTLRENGEYLDITEIGGYEVRYKLKSEDTYKVIQISDAFIDAYYFDYLKGEYEFQIATFDKDGLYSGFVDINPS
jgi:hypothetical protein